MPPQGVPRPCCQLGSSYPDVRCAHRRTEFHEVKLSRDLELRFAKLAWQTSGAQERLTPVEVKEVIVAAKVSARIRHGYVDVRNVNGFPRTRQCNEMLGRVRVSVPPPWSIVNLDVCEISVEGASTDDWGYDVVARAFLQSFAYSVISVGRPLTLPACALDRARAQGMMPQDTMQTSTEQTSDAPAHAVVLPADRQQTWLARRLDVQAAGLTLAVVPGSFRPESSSGVVCASTRVKFRFQDGAR